MAYDLVIKNARIVDGSGMPSYNGDVAVQAGRIVEIGRINGRSGRTLHADGLVVAPGFIDVHTHFDAQLLWDPLATSSCWHGVTTVVPGNCGFALTPCKPEQREAVMGTLVRAEGMSPEALHRGITWQWTTIGEYLDVLDQRLGLNVAALVGHNAVRYFVMGEEASERAATPEEMVAMQALVREGMAAGAFGLSTNQNPNHYNDDGRPVPSRLATDEELLALGAVLREYNRGVFQISRGQKRVPETAAFSQQFAQATGRPVLWSSITQRQNHEPDRWKKLLSMAAESFRQGAQSYAMVSPRSVDFRFTLKTVTIIFDDMPAWKATLAKKGPELVAALRDAAVRQAMRREVTDTSTPTLFAGRWDMLEVKTARRPEHQHLEGQSLQDIARQQGTDVLDTFLDLALAEDLATEFVRKGTISNEEALRTLFTSPYTLLGLSDAGAHVASDCGYAFSTNLLSTWVRDQQLLNLETAVYRLTFNLASVFGMYDRGLLRPGMMADLVVFDTDTVAALEPEMVADLPAGEQRLVQKSRGYKALVVNGQVLLEDGEHTGIYPGRVLRSGVV
jgi:N-acyl-D-aspartate/D-glutamate deacylase